MDRINFFDVQELCENDLITDADIHVFVDNWNNFADSVDRCRQTELAKEAGMSQSKISRMNFKNVKLIDFFKLSKITK